MPDIPILTFSAKKWYLSAAQEGDAPAQYRLFKMDAKAKSMKAQKDAQNRGEANAMPAQMYEESLGTEQNRFLSCTHYKKAHEQGQSNCIAEMQRVQKKITGQERQAAKYIVEKATQAQQEASLRCGGLADEENVKIKNRTVRIVGVDADAQKKDGVFTVYGDHERLYCIIDPKTDGEYEDYRKVDLHVKSTGNSVEVSDDSGALQRLYQFHHLKNCNLK